MRADHDIPPTAPPAAGIVHVFAATLDLPEEALAKARALLSPDETARADRFLRREDRARFTAARAWLRRVLAAHLGEAPEHLAFAYGEQGKPALDDPRGLDFNLAHSGPHALLAVSPGFPIGIDIEEERETEAKVAERFFSPSEVRALSAHRGDTRRSAFFRCWTRKEAYLKALGSGLATPLDGFTVSLDAGDARLLDIRDAPREAAEWQMADLSPSPGLAAALAARKRGWTIVHPHAR